MNFLMYLCLFFIPYIFNGQNVSLNGTVTDSLNIPLDDANIIAIPLNEHGTPKYTITNQNGEFTLLLDNTNYKLKISYLGYITKNVALSKNLRQPMVIILKQNTSKLEEVTLNYKPKPIEVKIDTITYNIQDFTDGSEYKMQDILKKLPGVEFNNGKIKVNGKDVTKVLVEGEKFFSGSTTLASENIPASAIKKLEFIDDYTDVAFLKNVHDSDKTIMNVKLNKPNKSFSFGELDAQYGNDNFYDTNPSYFNYSKKESIALLASGNNIGNPLSSIQYPVSKVWTIWKKKITLVMITTLRAPINSDTLKKR